MSDKPAAAASAPPKNKKMLLIIGVTVLVLALCAAGGWLYISKQRAALDDEGEEPVAKVEHRDPPIYLPLDNMVVNLADPGGEKVAQIGITLELMDSKAADKVKQYLPTIRNSILMLVSQRTSEELLQRPGKEKLAADILLEAARPFGEIEDGHADETAKKESAGSGKNKTAKKDKTQLERPVRRILFSSFIVQ